MKKHVFGRQFKRDANERKALFKGLVNALVIEESITTTEPKAKAIRGQVEKLITKAKNRGAQSKQFLQPWLQPTALEKVMNELSARFANRPGGYTRIIKLGERFGDNAAMAVIEFVEKPPVTKAVDDKKETKKSEKTEVEVTAKVAKSSAKKETKTSSKETKKETKTPKVSKAKKGEK